jgi:signal transduction histidine kinase
VSALAPSGRSALLHFVLSLGARPGELAADRASRQTLVLGGLLMSLGGVFWSALCLASGLPAPALVPSSYVLLTALNFAVLHRRRDFGLARLVQVSMSLLLPFVLQWALGGFAASGAMMLWSMIALVGSLTLSSVRQALGWFALYVALTVVAALLDSTLAASSSFRPSLDAQRLYVIVNVVFVSTIVFVLGLVLTRRQRGAILALELQQAQNRELTARLEAALSDREQDIERLRDAEGRLRELATGLETQVRGRTAELEEALVRAEDATRAKGEFLAVMSHEIRTPLHGILATSDLLVASRLDDEQRELVRLVRNSGDLLLTIINDLLDFSKIESGRFELRPRRVELARELEDQLALYRPLAAEHGVTLSVRLAPGLPDPAYLDGTRLAQVVGNLVGNAVKFTRTGSITVNVAAEPAGSRLRLLFSVTDTGVGIPLESLPRLFQPFSQVDSSSTRRFRGTGLGLAICARLVAMMGGRITVESAVGKGTTFRFDVLAEAGTGAPADAAGPAPLASPTRSRPLRVLVAEDNLVNQVIAQKLLRSLGCTVDLAANGAEAVELAERNPYDLVLMDLQMPVMDGLTATRVLCERLGAARPRIVAVTANAYQADRDACLAAGMDDFEPKPLLLAGLRRQLGLTTPVRGAA